MNRRTLFILGTLVGSACDPAATPADTLTADAWAPPNLVLAATGTPTAGADLPLTVTLPVVVSGKQTYFITTTAGEGAGIGACPGVLGGDCLDIAQPMDLWGPVTSVAGFSDVEISLPVGSEGTTLWAQAVVIHNGVGFKSNVISWEVQPDLSGGQLTLTNCGESYAAGTPDFFSTYFACVDVTLDNGDASVWTDGLPPHPTPYYAANDPNDTTWDARGGTHFQNPGQIGSQDVEFVIPSNPVAKGIVISSALVDNTMNTSAEEYSGGPVGVSLNGVLIFAAMAAPGDDLVDEQYTFDLYEGHPAGSTYHYHFETPGPLEVLVDRGMSSSSVPSEGEVELYGMMCDGTVVLGCTELDGSSPDDADFDAQNGHVHHITDGVANYFANRYHTHVCPSLWPNYPFFPEIAYYEDAPCPTPGPPGP